MNTTTKIDYLKPPLHFQAQLNMLEKRGLHINNKKSALISLSNINYYRLSAYCIPFKQRDPNGKITEQFQENTTLENVMELYEFDRKLRLLVMDALERVEISINAILNFKLKDTTISGSFGFREKFKIHKERLCPWKTLSSPYIA